LTEKALTINFVSLWKNVQTWAAIAVALYKHDNRQKVTTCHLDLHIKHQNFVISRAQLRHYKSLCIKLVKTY